jgi:hypothetical protein
MCDTVTSNPGKFYPNAITYDNKGAIIKYGDLTPSEV